MHPHNLDPHNRSIRGSVRRVSRLMPAVAAGLALVPAALSERPDILWMAAGHTDSVFSVAFSPDGGTLVSGSDDRRIILRRLSDGLPLKTYDEETGTGVLTVEVSPDGALFAYGRRDAIVVVARYPYPPCPGDLDGDGDVDLADLAVLLSCYGRNEGCGDTDGDGDTELDDLTTLLLWYGEPC